MLELNKYVIKERCNINDAPLSDSGIITISIVVNYLPLIQKKPSFHL